MSDPRESETRVTLLGRLRREPTHPSHWNEFVDLYGERVYVWCRRWGLQEADARDVTQNVLLKLASRMSHFEYDPNRSFRAWLKTVAHNAWKDFVEAQNRPGRGSGDSSVQALIESNSAPDGFANALEVELDRELMELASARVRLRVEPKTWEAFRLTAIEGMSGNEVSAQIDMKVAQVFVAKRRVLKMLQEEVDRLNAAG